MAKENIAFLVNLRKNIVEGSKMEGRYYPEAESKEALTTKGFAKHVADHGGMVTYEFMQLVLAAIVKCLKEMMSHGQPVKLDGLGTFRPTVTSVPGGAASVEEALRMGVNNLVEGVNFVFIPEKLRRSSRSSAHSSSLTSWRPSRRRSTARTSPTRCVLRCRLGTSSSRMPRVATMILLQVQAPRAVLAATAVATLEATLAVTPVAVATEVKTLIRISVWGLGPNA